MKTPAVTVLMTVFNAGKYLDPAITSIAAQTFRDWEFVIVDDASTDGSLETAEAWMKRDARIRVIRNDTNKGQTPCLNQGLREARGEWIARQDADDLSLPERLARQMEAAKDVALLGTNGWIIDANNRVTGLLDAPLTPAGIAATSPFLNPFMHTAVLARTAVIRDELGGYDESFRIAQDYDLWARVIERHPAANLPDRLVCYRHLATSLSKSGSGTAFAEARRVAEREAARIFGRALSGAELDLLAAFREGLPAGEREKFWQLHRTLLAKFPDSPDLRRTVALQHLKAAGAVGEPGAVLAEMVAAFRTAPGATLRWVGERLTAFSRRV
jgi:glycosyltransferase involved in cell wall biosynthesis